MGKTGGGQREESGPGRRKAHEKVLRQKKLGRTFSCGTDRGCDRASRGRQVLPGLGDGLGWFPPGPRILSALESHQRVWVKERHNLMCITLWLLYWSGARAELEGWPGVHSSVGRRH